MVGYLLQPEKAQDSGDFPFAVGAQGIAPPGNPAQNRRGERPAAWNLPD